MKGRFLFIGTGASLGVPMVGCECDVCLSSSPFNQRLRPSALITIEGKQFLIDAGPDFRLQALRYGIKKLDGLLLTHAHHDHTGGIDDLRALYYKNKKALPVLLSASTAEDIKVRYYYVFQSENRYEHSRFDLQILPALEGEVQFEGLPIQYVSYEQAGMLVNGFRFGNLAYISDIRLFSPSIYNYLFNLKHLVISALRLTSSPVHFSIEEAIEFAAHIKAENVWLTHISHELEHTQTNANLPAHVKLAYDGLEIEIG